LSIINFQSDFLWGVATSSYQIEGSIDKDGKGLSIWDIFSHKKGKIIDGTNGDISCDHYSRYKSDVKLMKYLGLKSYRFSLSWPRIYPDGKGSINQKGLDFYDKLTDELLVNNIEPFITLFHWDLPYELQKIGGWENRKVSDYFGIYAETAVKKLGDRVKYWITINEPWVFFLLGYIRGFHAPGIKNLFKAFNVMHNLLLGHGKAFERIKGFSSKLKAGIVNAFYPLYPYSKREIKKLTSYNAFINKLFMDPIFNGRYPKEIENIIYFFNRKIKSDDFLIIKKPVDFLGVNYYTRRIIKNSFVPLKFFKDYKPRYKGVQFTEMEWEIFPQGLYDILDWIKINYNNPLIYITENGAVFDDKNEIGKVNDIDRINYLKNHLIKLNESIKSGVNVKGYFLWSLLDNFEWSYGITKRFGIIYVDYKTQDRIIKESGYWYRNLCINNSFSV
jgi:beta-glucosidase